MKAKFKNEKYAAYNLLSRQYDCIGICCIGTDYFFFLAAEICMHVQ